MIYSFAKFYIFVPPHRFMTELVCNFFPASTSNSTEMMTFEWVLATAEKKRGKRKINSNNVNIVKCNEEITTRGRWRKEKFDAWHKTSPMGLISFSSSFVVISLLLPFLFFRKYDCFLCLKSRYIQMILNLRSTATRYFVSEERILYIV